MAPDVRFAVDRHGNTSRVRIGQSNGHPLRAAERLDTAKRGSPLPLPLPLPPAPPPEIGGDPVQVMVPVAFFIHRR